MLATTTPAARMSRKRAAARLAACATVAAVLSASPLLHAQSTTDPPPSAPQSAPELNAPTRPVDLAPRPLGSPRRSPDQSLASPEAGPATAQRPQNSPAQQTDASLLSGLMPSNPIARTGAALAIVLVCLTLCAAVARRLARGVGAAGLGAAFAGAAPSPQGILEVLARYPLSRSQTLILLKIDRRVLLLSQSAGRVRGGTGSLSTLCEITDPEEVAAILLRVQDAEGRTSSHRFNELLRRFDSTHDDVEVVPEGAALADARDQPFDPRAFGVESRKPQLVVVPRSAALKLSETSTADDRQPLSRPARKGRA